MTFEEVYKILYKKHKVARWDDVVQITVNDYEQYIEKLRSIKLLKKKKS